MKLDSQQKFDDEKNFKCVACCSSTGIQTNRFLRRILKSDSRTWVTSMTVT